MTSDPALQFWHHYAAREGALVDEEGARMVVVLPSQLQQRHGLEEAIEVTSDPSLAREAGVLLLIAGHPLLDAAASRVLEEGDAGHRWLEWPATPPPSAAQLLKAARDGVGVDHGRIDLAGVPAARYSPLLRVGSRVTYSLHDRFNEQEEVWVDAASGLPLPESLARQAATLPQLQGRPAHPAAPLDLSRAVASAHRLLEARTEARLRSLAAQVTRFRTDEETLAETYYRSALESIEERRQAAPPDRQALLDAQAEATRAEWARRREEIREKFAPQRELRPVRLHVVWVPSVSLPVVVRRGARAFPFTLSWWLPTAGFATPACPGCGSGAQLVASRDRLQCRECLPKAPQEASSPAQTLAPPPAAPAEPSPPAGSRQGDLTPRRPGGGGTLPGQPSWEVPPRTLAALRQAAEQLERSRRRVLRAGENLSISFWQAVFNGDSWPRKRADPASPLRIAYRLYGAAGPLWAAGLPPEVLPLQISSGTHEPEPGMLHCTDGFLRSTAGDFPFSLHWRMEMGKPAVQEVLPVLGAIDGRLSSILVAASLRQGPPPDPDPRRGELDPVAGTLWRTLLPRFGLSLVLRCLAAWERVRQRELPEGEEATLAAAVAAEVGRRAGLGLSRARAAEEFGADPGQVAAAARALQSDLKLSDWCWW